MKKILYVGSDFYGYEKEIINELKKNYEVLFLNYMPSTLKLSFLKILKIIFGNESYERKLSKEINKCLKKNILKNKINKEKIDILFVIGWSLLKKENLKFLEKFFILKNKKLYLWDDLTKIKNFNEYRDYFEEIYSFDREDCHKFNLIFRPTFYSERLKSLCEYDIIYDISFIGVYNFRRFLFLKKILKNYTKNYTLLYMNPYLYFFKYLFNTQYKFNYISFRKISRENYNKILKQSKIVVDLISDFQSGVTQRTLDALFLEKKVITNNKEVKKLEFYDRNNILIITENDSQKEIHLKIKEFNRLNYNKISNEIIDYYSIKRWVKDIFG